MNYKEKIEEIKKEFYETCVEGNTKNGGGYIDTDREGVDWLWQFIEEKLEQAQRDAVEGFVQFAGSALKETEVSGEDSFVLNTAMTEMMPDILVALQGQYLNQTKEDLNPKEGE